MDDQDVLPSRRVAELPDSPLPILSGIKSETRLGNPTWKPDSETRLGIQNGGASCTHFSAPTSRRPRMKRASIHPRIYCAHSFQRACRAHSSPGATAAAPPARPAGTPLRSGPAHMGAGGMQRGEGRGRVLQACWW
jgi:hypothetical protein